MHPIDYLSQHNPYPIKRKKRISDLILSFRREIAAIQASLARMSLPSLHPVTGSIPLPKKMSFAGVPAPVRAHLQEKTFYAATIAFTTKREVRLHIVTPMRTENLGRIVDPVRTWIHFLDRHASTHCSQTLHIYIYLTDLQKFLPMRRGEPIDEMHANTAYTTSCDKWNEIVVYRREEWFKVLMHETFHSFGLDFSGHFDPACRARILRTFRIRSEVNLYEAYTECWAEIMHIVFVAHDMASKDAEFLRTFYALWDLERAFSVFQMVKVLRSMNIRYEDLFDAASSPDRFQERTNVFAYYLATTILMVHGTDFVGWCLDHNPSGRPLQFNLGGKAQQEFCAFIERVYRSPGLIRMIRDQESEKRSNLLPAFYQKTMRMTLLN
jgi:hypothetical protein